MFRFLCAFNLHYWYYSRFSKPEFRECQRCDRLQINRDGRWEWSN